MSDEDAEVKQTAAQEIASEQRMENERLREDARLMQQLLAHPGWRRYVSMIEAVSQNYYLKIMTPMETSLEAVKMEHAKGTLNGLSLSAQLPSAKIREAADRLGSGVLDAEN